MHPHELISARSGKISTVRLDQPPNQSIDLSRESHGILGTSISGGLLPQRLLGTLGTLIERHVETSMLQVGANATCGPEHSQQKLEPSNADTS